MSKYPKEEQEVNTQIDSFQSLGGEKIIERLTEPKLKANRSMHTNGAHLWRPLFFKKIKKWSNSAATAPENLPVEIIVGFSQENYSSPADALQ